MKLLYISLFILFLIFGCDSPLEDPRIEEKAYSEKDRTKILDTFNSLSGKSKSCAEEFLNNYEKLVFDHCEKEGYGQGIGGGCSHVVGYSIHIAVLEEAMKNCNVKS